MKGGVKETWLQQVQVSSKIAVCKLLHTKYPSGFRLQVLRRVLHNAERTYPKIPGAETSLDFDHVSKGFARTFYCISSIISLMLSDVRMKEL